MTEKVVDIKQGRAKKRKPPQGREPTGDWRDCLVYKGDKAANCIANIAFILSSDDPWRGVIGSDEFAGGREVFLRGPPWDAEIAPSRAPKPGDPWTDVDDTRAAAWIQRHWSIQARTEMVGAAVRATAQQNAIHPIRTYLDSLLWDGTHRLPSWLATYLGAVASDYTEAVGTWWLVSAIARVRKPGCKADHVLVLEGPQGKKKSTALRVLFGDDYFTDELPELGSKDSYGALAGRWGVELAELDALTRAEVSRAKAFFSATTDRYRPPYGRRFVSVPRQCIFAGTVNSDDYLKDDTGNRRFWPVRIGEIDLDKLNANRDQLWAEADQAFQGGASWWPASEQVGIVEHEQEARFVADAWEPRIADWVARRLTDFTVGDVLGSALSIEPGKWSKSDQMRVAAVLRRLKCKKERARHDGIREWRWSR